MFRRIVESCSPDLPWDEEVKTKVGTRLTSEVPVSVLRRSTPLRPQITFSVVLMGSGDWGH